MAPSVVLAPSERAALARSMPWLTRSLPDRHADSWEENDQRFAVLEAGYGPCGGIASSDEVLLRLRANGWHQPLSRLARWIVARAVTSVEWQGATWLPLFQFDAAMSLRREVEVVTRELGDVFDDWELAAWFVRPSPWLGGATPLDALHERPADVHEAARADRFVARG